MATISEIQVRGNNRDIMDKSARGSIVDIIKAQETFGSAIIPNTGNTSRNGVEFTREGNTIHAEGVSASSGVTFHNIYYLDVPGNGIKGGDTIYVSWSSTNNGKLTAQLYLYAGSDTPYASYTGDNIPKTVTLDSNCTRIHVRAYVPNNTELDEYLTVSVQKYPTKETVFNSNSNEALPSCDLNNVTENGLYLLASGTAYTHNPVPDSALWLLVSTTGNNVLQVGFTYGNAYQVFKRDMNKINGVWKNWSYLSNWADTIKCLGIAGTDGSQFDLDELTNNGIYLMIDSVTYLHRPPYSGTGFIESIYTANWRLQIFYAFNGSKMYKRHGNGNATAWEDWQEIQGGSGETYNITNEYTYNHYSEAVTLNASPQITADTNNYLAPSGDTSDRTAAILAMLTSNGICRLGAGEYYIKNLQMPSGSSIIGSGYATKLIMASGDGYAIKMDTNCTLSDFALHGSTTTISVPALYVDPTAVNPQYAEGNRHGIIWEGTYTGDASQDDEATAPEHGTISNLHIKNFTGGGIRCYNTGKGTETGMVVTNVYIERCWAGIDIMRLSEFHKFTNVKAAWCRVGALNNGGNNMFVNCDFNHSLEIGMFMDNSSGDMPNNTHATCTACFFCHTVKDGQSNKGTGIKIVNCQPGFVFSGCQIFYSKVEIKNSNGIVFDGCLFGDQNCKVSIENGGTILFSDCMVTGRNASGSAEIEITNNNKCHFVNCYNKDDGTEWKP